MSSPVSVTGIVYFFEPNSGATLFATHHNEPSHRLLEPAQTKPQPEEKKYVHGLQPFLHPPTLIHHTHQLGDILLPPPGITRATTTEDSGAGQDVEAAPLLDSFQPYGQGTASMFV